MNKALAMDLNNFIFNNEQITIIMDKDNNPWFYGNQIAAILGYERPRNAILKHVDEEDKKKQMDIKLLSHNNKDLTYNEKNTIFINEPGFVFTYVIF